MCEEHHGSQWDLSAVRKGEKDGTGSQKNSGGGDVGDRVGEELQLVGPCWSLLRTLAFILRGTGALGTTE